MIQSITITGRKWFERTNGNTYHSAEAVIDGEMVGRVDYAYGYGDQWEQSAVDLLQASGKLPEPLTCYQSTRSNEPLRQYCERLGIKLYRHVSDVARKRDL